MPKRTANVSRNKRNRRHRATRRRRTNRRSVTTGQNMAVHRRLVLYPKVDDAKWLSGLAWFASVALKLFSLVTSVGDDLIADSAHIGSGTTIILGPGDFAALSPVSVPVSTTRTDKEVVCLKTFPYERAQLRHVTVKIVPSVDMGSRGGMYAACLIPIDPYDSTLVGSAQAPQILQRYSCSYDDIIKNPRAKMAPVNRPLSLSLNTGAKPANIRIAWDNTVGFINTYPACALMVAFSDLASKVGAIDSNYAPNKAVFEVHLTGQMSFCEPGELVVAHNSSESSMSCYTPKLCTSETKSINMRFFDHQFERTDGKLDLRTIDRGVAIKMLKHYDKEHLISKLDEASPPASDFEDLTM